MAGMCGTANLLHHGPGSRQRREPGSHNPSGGHVLMTYGLPTNPHLLKVLSTSQYHHPGTKPLTPAPLGSLPLLKS